VANLSSCGQPEIFATTGAAGDSYVALSGSYTDRDGWCRRLVAHQRDGGD